MTTEATCGPSARSNEQVGLCRHDRYEEVTMKGIRTFALITLAIVLGAGAATAQPQGDFDWCGELKDFEGCVAFYTVWPGPIMPVVLTDYGSFGIGDQVHVVGEFMPDQFVICGGFEDVPVVEVSLIESCRLSWCGELFEFKGCLLFNNREGEFVGLNNVEGYMAGDVIRITGDYVMGQQLVCDGGARFAIVDVDTVEPCTLESCCRGLVDGDADQDGQLTLSDIICLVNHLFIWPNPDCCVEEANISGGPGVDLSDIIYLVNYLFLGGPPLPPIPCTGP
ncbi:hypothetical protein GF420_16190 [candidate division GN15 bacterium]|nr:hypothetical protein [candidate division GN15 bacterium]